MCFHPPREELISIHPERTKRPKGGRVLSLERRGKAGLTIAIELCMT